MKIGVPIQVLGIHMMYKFVAYGRSGVSVM